MTYENVSIIILSALCRTPRPFQDQGDVTDIPSDTRAAINEAKSSEQEPGREEDDADDDGSGMWSEAESMTKAGEKLVVLKNNCGSALLLALNCSSLHLTNGLINGPVLIM